MSKLKLRSTIYTYTYIHVERYIYYIFFLCYPGKALEGPILTGVCINSRMFIQITTYKYKKITMLKI